MNDRDRELIDLMNNGTPEEQVRAAGVYHIRQQLTTFREYLRTADNTIKACTQSRTNLYLPEIHRLELLLKELGEPIE